MGVWIETLALPKEPKASVVTPCMGVWIETNSTVSTDGSFWSHPVWVCGLKLVAHQGIEPWGVSHPVWVCGLKLDPYKNSANASGHTLYGCVDWNYLPLTFVSGLSCHTLYGCVDWNTPPKLKLPLRGVTPCMGVWIETFLNITFNL